MLPGGSSKEAHEASPNLLQPDIQRSGSAREDRRFGCTSRARGPLSAADAGALGASTLAEDALGTRCRVGCRHVLLAFLAVRHFATTSWPLSQGQPGLLVAAGLLLLLAQALKAFGWARLFTNRERPSPVALVAGNGGAALIGVVLPGRFDDAMRIAVVRRYPGCRAGLRAISLSLVMLGLIDSAALAPLAAVAVAFPGAGIAARSALAVVAGAGVAAAAVIVALPRLAGSKRALQFRLGRWLSPRTTSLTAQLKRGGSSLAAGSSAAVASFILLGTLGLGYSFPLALLFLCAGAAAAALPVGRRARPPRQAPEPPRSLPRVSEHRRPLPPLSRRAPWESSPERPCCSSPLRGAPEGWTGAPEPKPQRRPDQQQTAPRPVGAKLAGTERATSGTRRRRNGPASEHRRMAGQRSGRP